MREDNRDGLRGERLNEDASEMPGMLLTNVAIEGNVDSPKPFRTSISQHIKDGDDGRLLPDDGRAHMYR